MCTWSFSEEFLSSIKGRIKGKLPTRMKGVHMQTPGAGSVFLLRYFLLREILIAQTSTRLIPCLPSK